MKYVLFYDPPATADPEAQTAHYPEHRALWSTFAGSSRLTMIGPFTDRAMGAMGIFSTREAAEDFAAADPFVRHGVVGGWRVVEWLEALAPESPAPPPGPVSPVDREGITSLQSRYADAVTRRAWGELAEMFLPDAALHLDTVSAEPRTLEGPDSIAAFIDAAVTRFDFFEFAILNSHVMADPGGSSEEATGRLWMCEVRHGSDGGDGSGPWSTAFGIYQDRYRRVDGRWWFAERRYRSLARTGDGGGVFPMPELIG